MSRNCWRKSRSRGMGVSMSAIDARIACRVFGGCADVHFMTAVCSLGLSPYVGTERLICCPRSSLRWSKSHLFRNKISWTCVKDGEDVRHDGGLTVTGGTEDDVPLPKASRSRRLSITGMSLPGGSLCGLPRGARRRRRWAQGI